MEYAKFKPVNPVFEVVTNDPSFTLDMPNFTLNNPFSTSRSDYMDDLLDLIHAPQDFTNTQSLTIKSSTSALPSNNLMSAIQSSLGTKYNNAKRLLPGFSDCSGFVNLVYKKLGINLKGQTSIGMWNKLTDHIDYSQVRPGDLVFLTSKSTRNVAGTTRRAGVDPSHVAIVVKKEGTRVQVAESTPGRGASLWWYELGGNNKPKLANTYNYSKGNTSGVKNELLGFGRIKGSNIS